MPALAITYCALNSTDIGENTIPYQNSLYTIFKEADTLENLLKNINKDEIDSLTFVEKQGTTYLQLHVLKYELKELKKNITNTRKNMFYAIKKTTILNAEKDNVTTFVDGDTLYGIYASENTITELKNTKNLQSDINDFIFVSSCVGIENGFEELPTTTVLAIRRALSGEIA